MVEEEVGAVEVQDHQGPVHIQGHRDPVLRAHHDPVIHQLTPASHQLTEQQTVYILTVPTKTLR